MAPPSSPKNPGARLERGSAIAIRRVLVLQALGRGAIEAEKFGYVLVVAEVDRSLQQRAEEIDIGLVGIEPVQGRGERAELPVEQHRDTIGGVGDRAEADAVALDIVGARLAAAG